MGDAQDYVGYKKAREEFAMWVYIILLLWLILAIVQWAIVLLVKDIRDFFKEHYYICFVAFVIAVIVFVLFLFIEKLRFTKILNFFVAFVIVSSYCTLLTLYPTVELQIIAVCAFVARTNLVDMIAFFILCLLLLLIAIIVGSLLPHKLDLTLDVAIIFVLSFIFMVIGMYFLMALFVIPDTKPYTFLVMEVFLSITIILFMAYHAQTINGSRFAEMRLNDFLLGSLILFHDFLIIYYTTFYWSVKYEPLKPKDFDLLRSVNVDGGSNDTSNISGRSPTFWGDMLRV